MKKSGKLLCGDCLDLLPQFKKSNHAERRGATPAPIASLREGEEKNEDDETPKFTIGWGVFTVICGILGLPLFL